MSSDPFSDFATPNCPQCLEPMEIVVGGFWCETDKIAINVAETEG